MTARVVSIDPSDPFLGTLAERIVDGTLWPHGLPDDPLALADVTVVLPTRRAARALAAAFLALRGPATVLPRITALGDAEDALAERAGVVGMLEARVALAALIRAWVAAVDRGVPEPDARVLMPSSGADAIRLADDLLALMDQVETQEADWADLPGLVAHADLAEHWQITTQFLEIATGAWPDHVAGVGKVSAAAARRAEADEAAARVGAARGPMIVAGSTGSIPATRRLIRAIAESPWGVVVLPGFDRGADAAAWAALAEAPDAPGHPQFGMRQLVEALGGVPEAVARLAPATPSRMGTGRTRLLAAALRPAPATGRWLGDRAAIDLDAALEGVALVEAADERAEAAAVAVAMRRSVEAGKTVALVTPHRALARRVAHALRRWNIAVDDSAGDPLGGTPAGTLARLVATAALTGGAAEWLALLKHPLCGLGLPRDTLRAGTRAAERMFRGPRIAARAITLTLRSQTVAGAPDLAAQALAAAIDAAFRPLLAVPANDTPVATLARAHAAVLNAVLQVPDPDAAAVQGSLFGDDPISSVTVRGGSGRDLAEVDAALADLAGRTELAIPATDWPATFDALITGLVVRGEPSGDAARILGPLEARLQAFDHVVLGALNEGTWPQLPDAGPWMSRGMMGAFGIDLPERRIGLSAHDFVEAAHAPRVTMTRAKKAGGDPTVASRWWQRIAAFAGPAAAVARARGEELLALAEALEGRASVPPAPRPHPAPTVAVRPTTLSVTEVAKLVRDPYAVYAKRILDLRPLDEIEADPSGGDRGELFHAILAAWVGSGAHLGPDAEAALRRIAEAELTRLDHAPEAQALWGARLRFIAADVVAAEASRPAAAHHVEAPAEMKLLAGATLRGRIDRIDVTPDGFEVIDYKSGAMPSQSQVATFFDPQLPLSAALIEAGAVAGVAAGLPVAGLSYVALAKGRVPIEWKPVGGGDPSALSAEALERLEALLALYADPGFGYLSRARVEREQEFSGDYDHLARAAEWNDSADADARSSPAALEGDAA